MTISQGAGRPLKSNQKLSKQRVIAVALPLVQKVGVEALSFRAIADVLGVTPMAVTYHSGTKKQLLADLVEVAFVGAIGKVRGDTAAKRARLILSRYFTCALANAHLLRAVLSDTSLMTPALINITESLSDNTKVLNNGDKNNVLLHVLVDYTHGFVLSASAATECPLSKKDFLRGLDWILNRTPNT